MNHNAKLNIEQLLEKHTTFTAIKALHVRVWPFYMLETKLGNYLLFLVLVIWAASLTTRNNHYRHSCNTRFHYSSKQTTPLMREWGRMTFIFTFDLFKCWVPFSTTMSLCTLTFICKPGLGKKSEPPSFSKWWNRWSATLKTVKPSHNDHWSACIHKMLSKSRALSMISICSEIC